MVEPPKTYTYFPNMGWGILMMLGITALCCVGVFFVQPPGPVITPAQTAAKGELIGIFALMGIGSSLVLFISYRNVSISLHEDHLTWTTWSNNLVQAAYSDLTISKRRSRVIYYQISRPDGKSISINSNLNDFDEFIERLSEKMGLDPSNLDSDNRSIIP